MFQRRFQSFSSFLPCWFFGVLVWPLLIIRCSNVILLVIGGWLNGRGSKRHHHLGSAPFRVSLAFCLKLTDANRAVSMAALLSMSISSEFSGKMKLVWCLNVQRRVQTTTTSWPRWASLAAPGAPWLTWNLFICCSRTYCFICSFKPGTLSLDVIQFLGLLPTLHVIKKPELCSCNLRVSDTQHLQINIQIFRLEQKKKYKFQ